MKNLKLLSTLFVLACVGNVYSEDTPDVFKTYTLKAHDFSGDYSSGIDRWTSIIVLRKNGTDTLITPCNLLGMTDRHSKCEPEQDNTPSLWDMRGQDRLCDNGASVKQNPYTDLAVRFEGGSYDAKARLVAIQLSISNKCRVEQISIGGKPSETVDLDCPNAHYRLYDIAQESIKQLLANNTADTKS